MGKKSYFDQLYETIVSPQMKNPIIYGTGSATAAFMFDFLWKGKVLRSYLLCIATFTSVMNFTQIYEQHKLVIEQVKLQQFKDYVRYDKFTRGTDIDEKLYEKPINYGRRF